MTNIATFIWPDRIVNLADRMVGIRDCATGVRTTVWRSKQYLVGRYCASFMGSFEFDPEEIIQVIRTGQYTSLQMLADALVGALNALGLDITRNRNVMCGHLSGYDGGIPTFHVVRNYRFRDPAMPEGNLPWMQGQPEFEVGPFFTRSPDWHGVPEILDWRSNGLFPWTIWGRETGAIQRAVANAATYLQWMGQDSTEDIREAFSITTFQTTITMFHCLNPRTAEFVGGGIDIIIQYPDGRTTEKVLDSRGLISKNG